MGKVKEFKKTKITDEELKSLQEVLQTKQTIRRVISDCEIKKYDALRALDEADMKLSMIQKELKDVYGDVNVNVNDGTIEERKKDAPN